MKVFYKKMLIKTGQNNLLDLEPKLAPYLHDLDFFHIEDLTEASQSWVKESGVSDGMLTVQAMHTTVIMAINELNEPCLLADLAIKLRESLPKNARYLHNSSVRTVNLCEEDTKCDRNGDAHCKAFLYGSPTQSVIIRDGLVQYGTWQRLCFIDLDGPRDRDLLVQIMGV